MVRAADWKRCRLVRLQAWPKNGAPLTGYTRQDEAWLQVAEGIRKVVEEFTSPRP